MREEGQVNMIRMVSGVQGELGRDARYMPEERQEHVCVEIFSIGPLFQELSYRQLYWDIQKPPFFRHVPI